MNHLETMADRSFVAAKMRRHYGPLLNCEPNFTFRPDGTATVWTGDGRTIELTVAEMEEWRRD